MYIITDYQGGVFKSGYSVHRWLWGWRWTDSSSNI